MTTRPGRTPATRFAVNVELWWTDLPQLDRLRQAAAYGFPAIELWRWWDWDVPAVADLCRELGLEVAQFGSWDFEPRLSDPANHGRFEDTVATATEVAATLGCHLVNINGPVLRAGESIDAALDSIVDVLRRVVPVLEHAGVTLMLEPMNVRVDHPGYVLSTSARVLDVVRHIGSPNVAVNWDLYHLQIAEGDLTGHLRDAIDHVAYVQIADHPGRHEPGTGELRFPYLLHALRQLGYDGYVGLECTPQLDPLTAAWRVHEADASSLFG